MRVSFPMIDGQMLDDMLERGGDFLLVDLRSEREYAAGRLRGAVNIPCSRLRAEYCGLPRDRLVVFYCGRGSNSLLACSRLAPLGFWVADLAGGLACYRGKFLEEGPGAQGNVDRSRRQDVQW